MALLRTTHAAEDYDIRVFLEVKTSIFREGALVTVEGKNFLE